MATQTEERGINVTHTTNIEVMGNGGITAKIVAHSISKRDDEIVSFQLRYPRFIHGELMTHRVFGRNAASSRAIPVKKMIEQVRNDPAMPIHWGQNQPGMQANSQLEGFKLKLAKVMWRGAAWVASYIAQGMNAVGLHKQVANRILEPFQFMHTVVTATEFDNFYHLRMHKDAQPEMRELAWCMNTAQDDSKPERLPDGHWHLPYVFDFEKATHPLNVLLKISAARCARVSYLNHDKSKPVVDNDVELYNMLAVRPYDNGKGHVACCG